METFAHPSGSLQTPFVAQFTHQAVEMIFKHNLLAAIKNCY